jgi:hypothetical protein
MEVDGSRWKSMDVDGSRWKSMEVDQSILTEMAEEKDILQKPEDVAERKVSETILQKPEEIVIGGETYTVAPPTTATLILVSEEMAKLPDFAGIGDENTLFEQLTKALNIAKGCRVLGDVLATLVLGAKRLKETKKRFFGLVEGKTVDNKAALAEKILNELSPEEFHNILFKLLSKLQTAFFLSSINFLTETNQMRLTKPTTTTTVSGR